MAQSWIQKELHIYAYDAEDRERDADLSGREPESTGEVEAVRVMVFGDRVGGIEAGGGEVDEPEGVEGANVESGESV